MKCTALAIAFPLVLVTALGLGSPIASVAGELCIGQSPNGVNGSVDCTVLPVLHPNAMVGYITTTDPCTVGKTNCPKVSDYVWTVSSSESDPYANEGPIPQLTSLYLWYVCPSVIEEGLAAAEFGLLGTNMIVLAFTAKNGFLNAGTAESPLLAVGGCPYGPVVAGEILVLNIPPVSVDSESWATIKGLYRE